MIIKNKVLIEIVGSLAWAVVGLLVGLLIGCASTSSMVPADVEEEFEYCIKEGWSVCGIEYDKGYDLYEVLAHD